MVWWFYEEEVYSIMENDDIMEKDDIENSHGCLCFFLGFFFGLIGLVIAAIISKARGVVNALYGMFARVGCAVAIAAIAYFGLSQGWFENIVDSIEGLYEWTMGRINVGL